MNVHNTKTRLLGSMVAFAGTFGLALAAQAGDVAPAAPKHDDVVVRYADLNLNSEAGVRVLYARLSDAAARACGDEPIGLDLKARAQYEECFDRTLEKAVGKVGNPDVQALHRVRKEGARVG
jgi:UrcA family protein